MASRADSENENQEVTPDTDTDSQEQLQKHQQLQNSFKRAPIMGNRGLETRNSKRSNQRKEIQSGSPPVVGALEVRNVKQAINRYGTLPKGARIGAYLESLRNTTDDTLVAPSVAALQQPPSQSALAALSGSAMLPPEAPAPPSNIPALSPRNGIKNQPQMIRSNSSGGVTMTNNATASLNKLQRHRTTTDGTTMMTTFSSFRRTPSNRKCNLQPTLADLQFPPPPEELPPPPEEFDEFEPTTSPYVMCGNSVDIPPKAQKPSNDVSNTAPTTVEASTRFGVSLRKREPSTDSCSSLGSPANDLQENSGRSPPAPSIKVFILTFNQKFSFNNFIFNNFRKNLIKNW